MNVTLKLGLLILVSSLLGYFSRQQLNKLSEDTLLIWILLTGILVIPTMGEMLFKLLVKKMSTNQVVALSKFSGHAFTLGIVLFFIFMGAAFNE